MTVEEYLPKDATTLAEVQQYFTIRTTELGMQLTNIELDSNGVYIATIFDHQNDELWHSVYIPLNLRGHGLFGKYTDLRIITIDDCGIVETLDHYGYNYKVAKGWFDFPEYQDIKKFYGNKKAKRSGVFLMNHITEGCNILSKIGASDDAIKAYMLHPIYQDDNEFCQNYSTLFSGKYSPEVVRNVVEYRKVANAYLCRDHTNHVTLESLPLICPLPLVDVQHMLFADKKQNQKDFLLYHKDTHPNSANLTKYFELWLEYLNLLLEG